MNLYLISQDENDSYDTFDSAVVCAPDENAARLMDPGGVDGEKSCFDGSWRSWAWVSSPDHVTVKLIGTAADDIPLGVVCSSYRAG